METSVRRPPPPVTPAGGPHAEVGVWFLSCAGLDPGTLALTEGLLGPSDRRRLAAITGSLARREFLAGRALLTSVLSLRTGEPPARWRFAETALGKPVLDDAAWSGRLGFNVSHTDGLVCCALVSGSGRVGVDVERCSRELDVDALAARFFAPAEAAALARLPAPARRARFFDHWTLKEAFLKGRGVGLTVPMREAAFDLEGPAPALVSSPDVPWKFALYRRFGFALAVAAESSGPVTFRLRAGAALCRRTLAPRSAGA